MSVLAAPSSQRQTIEDLLRQLGDIPPARVLLDRAHDTIGGPQLT
jgi:hypothetical protein